MVLRTPTMHVSMALVVLLLSRHLIQGMFNIEEKSNFKGKGFSSFKRNLVED